MYTLIIALIILFAVLLVLVILAQNSKGEDKEGYRIEFVTLVKSFGTLASR